MERGMIPMSILSKMGKYDIDFESHSVKVEVLDSAELISSWIIDHLKPKLQREEPVIVGLDLHASKNKWGNCSANSLLVICINDANCLVVQRKYVDKKPEILKKFLGDRKICFVGVGLDRKLSRGVPPSPDLLLCQKAELSHLVARIHKKPSYCNSDLKALAAMYEVPYKPPASGGCYGCGRINYEARVFSKEEVKALVHDAYVCYKIGQELVKRLNRKDTTEGIIQDGSNCSAMKQLWKQFSKCWNPPGHREHSEGNNSRNAGNNSGDPLPGHETTQGTTQGMQDPPDHETTQGTTQGMQDPPGHETTQETHEPPGYETTRGTTQETQEPPGQEITQETQEPPDHETTPRTTQETQEPPGHETTQETQKPPDHETTQGTTQETQESPSHERILGTQ